MLIWPIYLYKSFAVMCENVECKLGIKWYNEIIINIDRFINRLYLKQVINT